MKPIIRVGITHGDFNGVGYEVILKALDNPMMFDICTPVLYGSAKIASFYRKMLDLPQQPCQQIKDALQARDGQLNIINVIGEDAKVEPGVISKTAGAAALAALQQATADLRDGKIDVLVTAPISKNAIRSDEFSFPGHTEYLEQRLAPESEGEEKSDPARAMMILFNEHVRVALATVHLPISQVAAAITRDHLTDCIIRLNHTLRSDFGITRPRIAVLSLNPHAGEEGLLGTEEKEAIIPALEAASAQKVLCFGPYPSDGFFGAANFRRFDAVLAMYHDQGLTPMKTLSMDGVNFTAGLSKVRTSPDHGTAFDIAGKGIASCESMRQAIYAAIDIYSHRERFAEITANPLRKQYFEKNKNDNVVLDLSKSNDE